MAPIIQVGRTLMSRRPLYGYMMASTAIVLILAVGAFAHQTENVKADQVAALFTDRFPTDLAPAPAVPVNEEAAKPGDPVAAPMVVAEQPPDPLASLDPADRVVSEKIRDLLATRSDRIFSGKKERTAVEAFYQNRNLLPLWLDKGIE